MRALKWIWRVIWCPPSEDRSPAQYVSLFILMVALTFAGMLSRDSIVAYYCGAAAMYLLGTIYLSVAYIQGRISVMNENVEAAEARIRELTQIQEELSGTDQG